MKGSNLNSANEKERGTKESGICASCLHKKGLQMGDGVSELITCRHPKFLETQEKFPERKPGWIAARALNEMGKKLNPKINSAAYRNRFFNWPHCYNTILVESCAGFEKADQDIQKGGKK